jgi:F-type H+-transporting ATPase subunit a
MEAHAAPHISLAAEKLFEIGHFPVTNSLLLSAIALVLLISVGLILRRSFSMVPGTFQSLVESAIEGLLGLMDSVLGKRALSERYLPIVATIFLFVMTSNWLGLFPGIGPIVFRGEHETAPLFRAPSSDLNFTLALAVISVLATNVIGVAALGFFKHGKKYFNFGNPIAFFVGILELISEFAKMVSFSFRLFGNVFAGEVLLVIIAFLVPYVVPLPFLFLEVFVGFIQAFIFAMLTLVFIATAVTEHAEH